MVRLIKLLIYILTISGSVIASGGEEITRISLIEADTGHEASLRKRTTADRVRPRIGDSLILHAGKSGNYNIEVTESRHSKFGNTVIHGVNASGGKSVMVISENGYITGNLDLHDGKVRVTTDNDGIVTAWREGIDAIALPICDGSIIPLADDTAFIGMASNDLSSETHLAQRRISRAYRETEDVGYPRFETGQSTVTILLYYDDSMSDPLGVADYVLELTNDALRVSGVPVTASIVESLPVSISPSDSNGELIDKMNTAESPFADIAHDRAHANADLQILLRGEKAERGDSCGVAFQGVYLGTHRRSSAEAVVEWRPAGSGWTCSEDAFAHEVGHLLGSRHRRIDHDDEDLHGATSYAWGFSNDYQATIMASIGSGRVRRFSSPLLDCGGQPCGIDISQSKSADNVRAFTNSGPLISANSGTSFSHESIAVGRVLSSQSCDEGEGEFRGTWLRNNSSFDLEMHSQLYQKADGTSQTFSAETTLEPGGYFARGYCTITGEESLIGTTYKATFFRYLHPQTQEVLETARIPWGDGFGEDESIIRAAFTDGGTLEGHPEKLVKVGSEYTVMFTPHSSYELERIDATCDGERIGNDFRVSVREDNCRVEAIFGKVADCFGGPNLNSLSTEQQIQLVYVGLLSRAADAPGLNYWVSDINNGFSIEKLRENIVCCQTEYLEGLGKLDRSELVTSLYQNLFNRSPREEGKAYWVSGGGSGVSADRLVLALINGAGCTDQQALENKAEAASYYTSNYSTYDKTDATRAVSDVDSAAESLEAAKELIDSLGG